MRHCQLHLCIEGISSVGPVARTIIGLEPTQESPRYATATPLWHVSWTYQMHTPPTAFISSTYYDLKQVRRDVDEALDQFGCRPLRSEQQSFPINPDLDTIRNCTTAVNLYADILVLVIGARYGYVEPASDKSVTNLEYSAARTKGIPIYVFIDQAVLNQLPIYKQNPEADYSGIVDNARLFDFVDEVRSKDRVWTFPFSECQDIAATLKVQLGYLFSDSLAFRRTLRRPESDWMRTLTPEAFRLVIERPEVWPGRLFAQVLSDEMDRLAEERWEHLFGLRIGAGELVNKDTFNDFITRRISESLRAVTSMDSVMSNALMPTIMGGSATAEPRTIVFCAKQISAAYQELLRVSGEYRKARVPAYLDEVFTALPTLNDKVLEEVLAYGPRCLETIAAALVNRPTDGVINLHLDVTIDDEALNAVLTSMADLTLRMQTHPEDFLDDEPSIFKGDS